MVSQIRRRSAGFRRCLGSCAPRSDRRETALEVEAGAPPVRGRLRPRANAVGKLDERSDWSVQPSARSSYALAEQPGLPSRAAGSPSRSDRPNHGRGRR